VKQSFGLAITCAVLILCDAASATEKHKGGRTYKECRKLAIAEGTNSRSEALSRQLQGTRRCRAANKPSGFHCSLYGRQVSWITCFGDTFMSAIGPKQT
jgi:hypothetical protein